MKKAETIRKYGEKVWEKHLEQARARYAANPEKAKAASAAWAAANPEKVKAKNAAWAAANPEKVKQKNIKNKLWMSNWYRDNPVEAKERALQWRLNNPDKIKTHDAEISHKDGKYYQQATERHFRPIPHTKALIRVKHAKLYRPIKRIIDPRGLSNLHHRWRTKSSEYIAVGIVEAKGHRHGVINVFNAEDCPYEDVIQLLSGKITLAKEKDLPKFETRLLNSIERGLAVKSQK